MAEVRMFTEVEIGVMLDRAAAMGFDLEQVPSPLEELTLAELDLLTQHAGTA